MKVCSRWGGGEGGVCLCACLSSSGGPPSARVSVRAIACARTHVRLRACAHDDCGRASLASPWVGLNGCFTHCRVRRSLREREGGDLERVRDREREQRHNTYTRRVLSHTTFKEKFQTRDSTITRPRITHPPITHQVISQSNTRHVRCALFLLPARFRNGRAETGHSPQLVRQSRSIAG